MLPRAPLGGIVNDLYFLHDNSFSIERERFGEGKSVTVTKGN